MENSKATPSTASPRSGHGTERVRRDIALIDNYDSFTYNVVQLLARHGARCTVFQNDAIAVETVVAMNPAGIVLCPGPAAPDRAGITLKLIEAAFERIPLLGICLGHQAIGQTFGADVRTASQLVHGKTSPIVHRGEGLFRGIPSPFHAARYHSLVVDPTSLPECLEKTAWTPNGDLMGIRHRHRNVHGVQFHPESILSEYGSRLMANWLEAL